MFNRPGRQALMEYIELNHKIQREKKVFVQFVLGLFYQYLTSAYPPNRLLPGLGTCSHLSPNHQLTRCSLTILTDGLPQMGLIANKTTTTNKEGTRQSKQCNSLIWIIILVLICYRKGRLRQRIFSPTSTFALDFGCHKRAQIWSK